ncbi:cytidine deaminase-like protein [Dothidotthia symphoricarpi CBS 119687]|uniref:Cytidine deaminase-like protein n=1 Tax=Dothidotthia symphoricarpi CBS 119687 TaxID=1392245 RepID=A0A6A5ZXM2_9PLEO|nr:cytidine deaminase-like protein [Dothidotthia symphoricarpi CBS 119687]KAF2124512.1 cytidine deaminase-like protein [Dothidotthia symphoricarpi CBS 119687]
MSTQADSPSTLISSLLKTVEQDIIPLTQKGVSSGSKVFGAAILSRADLKPLTVATNNERVSPLLHGEINCIQQFFTVDFPDPTTRPDPRKDCIFFATHEPCSLCLSGITWSGFTEFYYLFTYEDSRDLFAIPYDIDILEQVFRVKGEETEEQLERRPLYNRTNKFFHAKSLVNVVGEIGDETEQKKWLAEIDRIKGLYNALSETYQEGKAANAQTSSAWK